MVRRPNVHHRRIRRYLWHGGECGVRGCAARNYMIPTQKGG